MAPKVCTFTSLPRFLFLGKFSKTCYFLTSEDSEHLICWWRGHQASIAGQVWRLLGIIIFVPSFHVNCHWFLFAVSGSEMTILIEPPSLVKPNKQALPWAKRGEMMVSVLSARPPISATMLAQQTDVSWNKMHGLCPFTIVLLLKSVSIWFHLVIIWWQNLLEVWLPGRQAIQLFCMKKEVGNCYLFPFYTAWSIGKGCSMPTTNLWVNLTDLPGIYARPLVGH